MKHEKVLAWVNEIRARYDLGEPLTEMPKGRRMAGSECPMARALKCYVSYSKYNPSFGEWVVLPQFVSNFIGDFDTGRFPELVEA